MSRQMNPSEDASASSRLLMEDVHQGVTSAAAAAAAARYRAFVASHDAPIAHMNYSPFHNPNKHHARQQHTPRTSSAQSMEEEDTARRREKRAPSTHGAQLEEEVIPASSSALHSARSSAASSRAHSPVPADDFFDNPGVEGRDPYLPLNPSVPHANRGGAAWTVDFNNVNDKNLAPETASGLNSKRGSLSSRKSSLNIGGSKLWAQGRGQTGYESSQQIWLMQGADARQMHRESLSHRGHDKESPLEAQHESVDRLSEPPKSKRLSLKQPFLRAHATEEKIGVTRDSRPLHGGQQQSQLPPHQGGAGKAKRSSMPPLRNQNLLPANRQGSQTLRVSSHPPNSASVQSSRQRSQSLPSDSLFLTYSQCALPAVLTSSLAAMPIPSQPAIPVEVARRYSLLAAAPHPSAQQSHPAQQHDASHALPHSRSEDSLNTDGAGGASSEGMVHVNPEAVEGIDTSSVLDTSYLRDLATDSPQEGEEEVVQPPQPARRGSLSRAVAAEFQDESRQPSPAPSPVGVDASPQGPSPSSLPSFPDIVAMPESMPGSSPVAAPSIQDRDHVAPDSKRSRSLQNKRTSYATLPARLSHTDHPTTPDFTPMTSPTNLGAPAFRATLMSRRMSDVVARDIGKKLRILKQHMAQQAEETSAAAAAANGNNGQGKEENREAKS